MRVGSAGKTDPQSGLCRTQKRQANSTAVACDEVNKVGSRSGVSWARVAVNVQCVG